MAETVLDFISGLSKEKREALQTQAQADIVARNAALHAAKPDVATETQADKAAPVLKAAAINEEQGVIVMVGALADAIDLDQDTVPASLLVKCAHDFCGRDGRVFKANHAEEVSAKLVESMTGVPILKSGRRLKAGEHIPIDDPMVSVGLIKGDGEATAWIVGVKPEDPALVAEAKAGRVSGASWGGYAKRSARA